MSELANCRVVSMRTLDGCGNLKAFADIQIGGALVIKKCTVFDGKRGLFANLPREAGKDGKWWDLVIASDDDLKSHYEDVIIQAYHQQVDQN